MPIPFLTGLGRVLDTALGKDGWTGVPGWETRTGYTEDRTGAPRGYSDVYGAILHTTESPDSAFEKAGEPRASGDEPMRQRPGPRRTT